ncbi:MAG: DMT family transporter [Anaerolineae bacterium]|nr:DMT family transporter [Anaerolineae bacterium]
MKRTQVYPIIQALLAAAMFGLSAPLAKLLLGQIEPIPLAAFLYLGSGIGLALYKGIQRLRRTSRQAEAQVRRADIPWVIGALLTGGVAGPILLMVSLRHTPAATASLLLNFEGVATTLIAAAAFKEAVDRRVWWAIVLITLASVLLSWSSGSAWGISWGALGVLGACAMWGIDNNLTRNISAKDPLTTVAIKGLGAGSFSLLLALALGNPFPRWPAALGAMALGSVSYGLGIVLFILALRGLGAARTSALYGAAPFVGAIFSFLLLKESLTASFIIAFAMMIAGAALLLGEKHRHIHLHPTLEHEHRHRHDDEHHGHEHTEEVAPETAHSHVHRHAETEHTHPHMPDIHHRHGHEKTVDH